MKRINFALGIHNHQPVGNFDFVFEEAYQRAYLPFLEVLENHPQIKIAQHFSGVLFEWILKHHPDFIPRLRALVESGQVEMMTGGYYEPILTVIPDKDKMGQIQKLTEFVIRHTGFTPRGLWLAERIWEPHLPKHLREAGIDYTIVDDSHFKYIGLREEDLIGYFLTEEEGYTVSIFPIAEKLRYTIPFREPEQTLDYLRGMATEEGDRLIVFADDGEKFGIWPGTYDHVFKKGWLEQFFNLLEENSDWIKLVHFTEALKNIKPVGRVYLPTASYREMLHWALPPKAFQEYEDFEQRLKNLNLMGKYGVYVRGGFWRYFLAKYPEANHLHKRMLLVSRRVWDAWEDHKDRKVEQARDHLWAAQCNCPYWHGIFGGLYLSHLRHAVYKHLIRAETLLDEVEHPSNSPRGWIEYQILDFDGDGREEILISTKSLNLYLAPETGGSLLELDYKPEAFNLMNTMTRREEGYHRRLRRFENKKDSPEGQVASIHDLVLTKEEGLQKQLHYDWYRRCSLIDHFLNPKTTLEDFAYCQYSEQGDFVEQPYSYQMEKDDGLLKLRLERTGRVRAQGREVPLHLSKTLRIHPVRPEIIIDYTIINKGNLSILLRFGTEFNLSLLAGDSPDRYYFFPGVNLEDKRLKSMGRVREVSKMELRDCWSGFRIEINFTRSPWIWRFPIETISLSEAGFERVYQSSVVFPNWEICLKPDREWHSGKISFKILPIYSKNFP